MIKAGPLNTLAMHASKAKLHLKKFYDDCLRHRPEIFSSRQSLRNKTRPAEIGFRTSSKIRCWGSGRLPERKSLKIKIEKKTTQMIMKRYLLRQNLWQKTPILLAAGDKRSLTLAPWPMGQMNRINLLLCRPSTQGQHNFINLPVCYHSNSRQCTSKVIRFWNYVNNY
jgi:hypothetical protein